eukprot:TRINITY_DN111656_c0_g1_i1.p1 TRINITY_DN111656_c0_g1~~TRINITY_DN111656_c0_g1_i1.p1  ORF type:complete len:727 (+),score=142.82 TRINITY_DN111656_c0_g1_i1:89-2269(+)
MAADSKAVVFQYTPEHAAHDVGVLAAYFVARYGTLKEARKTLNPDVQLDQADFAKLLKGYKGLPPVDAYYLFNELDKDWSGSIDIHELFSVLESPAEELKKRREEKRLQDVDKVCHVMAKCIREKFGSIESGIAAVKGGTPGADEVRSTSKGPEGLLELSKAEFRRFVNGLPISEELGGEGVYPQRLDKVWREIDTDESGSISVKELQKALQTYMVRDELASIGEMLVKEHGSVKAAFDKLQPPRPTPITPAATTPAAASQSSGLAGLYGSQSTLAFGSPSATTATAASDKKAETPARGWPSPPSASSPGSAAESTVILRHTLLHLMKDVVVNEEVLKMMTETIDPFTVDELEKRMQAEQKKIADMRAKRQAELEKKEAERKKRARMAFCADSREAAAKVVDEWGGKAEATRDKKSIQSFDPGDITRDWAAAARVGKSKAQMSDYLQQLEKRLRDRQEAMEAVAQELKQASSCAPDASADELKRHLSKKFGAGAGNRPGLKRTGSMKHRSKVAQAQKVIQAAASGDVAEMVRALAACEDDAVDAVAWNGLTPLMTASRHGRVAVVECLLARGADPDRTDAYGRTAVDHAYKQALTRECLRARGARTGRELTAEAEELARRILEVEAARAFFDEELQKTSALKRTQTKSPGAPLHHAESLKGHSFGLHQPGGASPSPLVPPGGYYAAVAAGNLPGAGRPAPAPLMQPPLLPIDRARRVSFTAPTVYY